MGLFNWLLGKPRKGNSGDLRIENIVEKLISLNDNVFGEGLSEALAIPENDPIRIRVLREAIRRRSGEREVRFYEPNVGGLTMRDGNELMEARNELLSLAKKNSLLNDPQLSGNLLAALTTIGGFDAIVKLAQEIRDVVGLDEFQAFQLLYNQNRTAVVLRTSHGEVTCTQSNDNDVKIEYDSSTIMRYINCVYPIIRLTYISEDILNTPQVPSDKSTWATETPLIIPQKRITGFSNFSNNEIKMYVLTSQHITSFNDEQILLVFEGQGANDEHSFAFGFTFSFDAEWLRFLLIAEKFSIPSDKEDEAVISVTLTGNEFKNAIQQWLTRCSTDKPITTIKAIGADHPNITADKNIDTIKRQLKKIEKRLGPEHPSTANLLYELAMIYLRQENYDQAEPLFQRALKIDEKALGFEHQEVATTLNCLGELFYKQGYYNKAESTFQQALAIREKVLGPSHQEVATSLNWLGMLYFNQENYAKAETLFQRGLAIYENTPGQDHPYVTNTLNCLAELYEVQGREEDRTKIMAKMN